MAVVLLASCKGNKSVAQKPALTGEVKTDVVNLLPAGKVTAEVLDSIRVSPRQAELTKKFQEGVQKNETWFASYMQSVPEGQPMPYHANMGLSKAEYEELQGFAETTDVISSGNEEITIEKKGEVIEFKAQGKLEVLNHVKIDLKTNTVKVGELDLPFADKDEITTDKNGLKSKWKGYTWSFEDTNGSEDPQTLSAVIYKVTIGQLEKNGKTLLKIKGVEMEEGEKSVEFDLPVVF